MLKLDVLIKYLRKDEALRSLFLQLNFRSISLSQIEKGTRKTKYFLHTINGYVELLLNIYIFLFITTYNHELSAILKKKPRRFKIHAGLSNPNVIRSKEAERRVIQAQSTNSAYADLAGEVLLILFQINQRIRYMYQHV